MISQFRFMLSITPESSASTYPEFASLCHQNAIWRSEESRMVKSPTSLSLGEKRMGELGHSRSLT